MLDSANISETEKQLVQTTAKTNGRLTRFHMPFKNCTLSFMKKKVAQQHSHVNRDSHMPHHKETGTKSDLLLDNIHLDLLNIDTVNLKEKVHEDSHDEHTTLTRYPMTMMTLRTMRTNTKYLPQTTHHHPTKTNTTATQQPMTLKNTQTYRTRSNKTSYARFLQPDLTPTTSPTKKQITYKMS